MRLIKTVLAALCAGAMLGFVAEAAAAAPMPFTVSDVLVELPSHEPPDGGEIVAPAHGQTCRSGSG